jgi:hypothetical protein
MPGEVVAPETAAKAEPSLRESMADFLKTDETPEAVEAAPEGQEESKEADSAVAEASDEEQDDSEEQEEGKKADPEKKDESKKPNRYQRLKSQRDEAVKQLKATKEEAHKATVVANQWFREAQRQRELLASVMKEKGISLDPRDIELHNTRGQMEARQIQEQAEQRRAAERAKEIEAEQKATLKEQFQEEADSLTQKYPGLTRKQILNAYAGVLEAEQDLTMEEVAENLAIALKKPIRASAEKAQRAATAAAPQPIRAGRSAAPKFNADKDGMKGFLKSTGLL